MRVKADAPEPGLRVAVASACLAAAPCDAARQRSDGGQCDARGRFRVGTICTPRVPAPDTMPCHPPLDFALA